MSVYSVTCFSVVRLVVRARFTLGEHRNILHFARRYSGVSARGCRGRSRHYLAQLVIHYQSSNNIHFLEQRNVRKLTNMPCGIFKQAMASLYHEIACIVFQLHETVCRLLFCPVQLSPKFPAGCFSPKPTLSAPSSKPSLTPLPRLPSLVIPPQTTPAVSAITPTMALHVIIPTVAVPFQKTYPCFLHSILELSLAFSASKFQDGSTPLDRTVRTRCFCKKTRNLKFCKCET